MDKKLSKIRIPVHFYKGWPLVKAMDLVIYFQGESIENIYKLCIEPNIGLNINHIVTRMSLSEFSSKRWFIAFDASSIKYNQDIQQWFHSDEDPILFIKNKFINTSETCPTISEDEECSFIHSDKMNYGINMSHALCSKLGDSYGNKCGLRVITNESYPDMFGDSPRIYEKEDLCNLIYIYDTSKFEDVEIITGPHFHMKTMRKIDEYNSSDEAISLITNIMTETYLNKYCPFCQTVYIDWSGCLQLECSNILCQKYFCGLCLIFGTSSKRLLEKHYETCDKYDELSLNLITEHGVLRFKLLKEAIYHIGPEIKNKIIRELLYKSKDTKIHELIWEEYRKMLMWCLGK